jgi:uncharacterized protein (DUF305 family)
MKHTLFLSLAICLTLIVSTPLKAEEMMNMPMGHDHAKMMEEMNAKNAPHSAYDDAMNKMHNDMMVKPSGNVDVDFVKGMIPHHQGAIDMANIVLKQGNDPIIRKLATGIVTAQESEIKMMKEWLAKHDKPPVK